MQTNRDALLERLTLFTNQTLGPRLLNVKTKGRALQLVVRRAQTRSKSAVQSDSML